MKVGKSEGRNEKCARRRFLLVFSEVDDSLIGINRDQRNLPNMLCAIETNGLQFVHVGKQPKTPSFLVHWSI
jgi:hypothetical protein